MTDMNGQDPMDEGGSAAGDALSAAPPQVGEGNQNMVTVPMDMMPGCKVGDTYTVKSVDNDNVMLEMSGGKEPEDDWGEGLKKAAPRPM